jgi:WD40 repeat protein
VWDATNGQDLLTLHGHISVVTSVAWSPNGKRLATSGDDGIVQIYPYDDIELLRLVHSRIARSLSEYECQRYFNTGACPPLPETP